MRKIYLLILQRRLLLFLIGVTISTAFSCSDDENHEPNKQLPVSRVSIIPLPESIVHGRYNIPIPKDATVSESINGIGAELLSETLTEIVGSAGSADNENAFIRIYSDNSLNEEEYRITVKDDGCSIHYKTQIGLLWGIQTIRQILLQNSVAEGSKSIPLLTISDAPKKAWRGFHIDVARHMLTLDYLKEVVDILSFYKINKLQMHLTDDQGWRIEIKKYPKLTTVGGWREFDEYDKRCIEKSKTDASYTIDSRFVRNGNEYGGYYTQEELKDFINYATARGVDVIPEIDMPGHFSAAIRTFPHLSCTGEAGWGHEFSYPVCAGKTENYQFFKDIINEVATLFPSNYFHVGADEVEKDNWRKCPDCQKLIRDQGLHDTDGLQNYFIKEMADYAKNSKNKKVMAWDDAFIAKDPQEFLYTYWRDWKSDQPAKISQQGFPMVFMEWGRFYFSADPSDHLLQSLYEFEFEPQFKGIVKEKVIGFQACVWTEMIPNETKFEHHVFPSLQAFTELAWGSQREWTSFTSRLPWHLRWLKQMGYESRTPGFIQ
ncbi:MAG: beta-N-acetylhexosaminidase [Dysgonamonadaceae bacterium]|nr:beta-N-acetylhexosaminidase [Dysgonamonadaceae bacterium]